MLFTEAEMNAEREKRGKLEDFLRRTDATQCWPDRWQFNDHASDLQAQRDNARLERDQARAARDAAEMRLVALGWKQPPGGEWTAPVNAADRMTVSRFPDPVTPAKVSARMIALPVLDAIALLAVLDRYAAPFDGSTKAAEALGELEQAVEAWLDERAA